MTDHAFICIGSMLSLQDIDEVMSINFFIIRHPCLNMVTLIYSLSKMKDMKETAFKVC